MAWMLGGVDHREMNHSMPGVRRVWEGGVDYSAFKERNGSVPEKSGVT